jgi:RHS repeat-associated protein
VTQRITRLLALFGLFLLFTGASTSAASVTAAGGTAAPEAAVTASAFDDVPTVVDGLSTLPGEVIGDPPPPPPEVIEYYAVDAIGSTRVVFAADGTVLGRVDYAPFGEELPGANAPPERFTGQARDTEAGMDYFGARYYQSRLGRFGTIDPLNAGAVTNPQRWNRYAYALNNPLAVIDPDGRQADSCMDAENLEMEDGDDISGGGCQDGGGGGGLANDGAGVVAALGNLVNLVSGLADSFLTQIGVPVSLVDEQSVGFNGYKDPTSMDVFMSRATDAAVIAGAMVPLAGPATRFALEGAAEGVVEASKGTETFFRTMSAEHLETLVNTGKVSATGETFISPSLETASKYNGVTVQFNVQAGTTDALLDMGVRNAGLTQAPFGNLPLVQSGWGNSNAFFKLEGGVVNIGLGQGPALNTFNNNIVNFTVVFGR